MGKYRYSTIQESTFLPSQGEWRTFLMDGDPHYFWKGEPLNNTAKYILKTTAKALSLIIALSIITFALVEISPIDPVKAFIGAEHSVSPEQMALIREKWGLNDPAPIRYLRWIGNLIQGEMGDSQVYKRPVAEVISRSIANSFLLMLISWLLSGIFGFLLGIVSAVYRDSWLDRGIQTFCYVQPKVKPRKSSLKCRLCWALTL